jgi:hypothetical protein
MQNNSVNYKPAGRTCTVSHIAKQNRRKEKTGEEANVRLEQPI